MQRVKSIEEIFCKFTLDETALSIVHIDGDKGKTRLPFIVEPAASDNCLSSFFAAEPVHNEEEDEAFPAIIRVQKYGDGQKSQYTQKLNGTLFPEILDGAECCIAKEQGEKYILLLVAPGIREHEIPRDFRNTGKDKKISAVFETVPCMKEALHKKKAENRESGPPNISADTVQVIISFVQGEQSLAGRLISGKQYKRRVVDQHNDHGNDFQDAAA